MGSIKIELPRISNAFNCALVISVLILLYSLSFEIRSMYQGSFTAFHKIVILAFWYSAASAFFWHLNGSLKKILERKNLEMVQLVLVLVFISILVVLWWLVF